MNKDENSIRPGFWKRFPISLAIWHWGNLLVISCILITVLLVKTIFNGKENATLIQNTLEKKNIIVNIDQARAVAKIYTHKLWDWHVYFGYLLSGLFLFRIILEFFQLVDQRFFRILKNARLYVKEHTTRDKNPKQFLIVRCIYFLFYFALTLMICTGLFLEFSDNYPDLKSIRSIIKEIHNIGMYTILAFIATHLAGLLIRERTKRQNFVE